MFAQVVSVFACKISVHGCEICNQSGVCSNGSFAGHIRIVTVVRDVIGEVSLGILIFILLRHIPPCCEVGVRGVDLVCR